MKTVGIREFRDHATKYLAEGEPLAIERHGQTIGYFFPSKRDRSEEIKKGIEELNAMIEQVLQQTGMTRDEFEELMATPLTDEEQAEADRMIAERNSAVGD